MISALRRRWRSGAILLSLAMIAFWLGFAGASLLAGPLSAAGIGAVALNGLRVRDGWVEIDRLWLSGAASGSIDRLRLSLQSRPPYLARLRADTVRLTLRAGPRDQGSSATNLPDIPTLPPLEITALHLRGVDSAGAELGRFDGAVMPASGDGAGGLRLVGAARIARQSLNGALTVAGGNPAQPAPENRILLAIGDVRLAGRSLAGDAEIVWTGQGLPALRADLASGKDRLSLAVRQIDCAGLCAAISLRGRVGAIRFDLPAEAHLRGSGWSLILADGGTGSFAANDIAVEATVTERLTVAGALGDPRRLVLSGDAALAVEAGSSSLSADLQLSGTLDLDGSGGFAYRPDPCLQVTALSLRVEAASVEVSPICLGFGAGSLVAFARDTGLGLDMTGEAARVRLTRPENVGLDTSVARWSFRGTDLMDEPAMLTLSDLALDSDIARVSLAQLGGSVSIMPLAVALRFDKARLDPALPLPIKPLSVTGELAYEAGPAADLRLGPWGANARPIELSLQTAEQGLSARISAEIEAVNLSAYSDRIRGVEAGRVMVDAGVTRADGGLNGQGRIVLEGIAGSLAGVGYHDLSGDIAVTLAGNPARFSTPPGQRIAIGRLDAGTMIEDILSIGRYQDGRVEIESGLARLAGGTASVSDLHLDPDAPTIATTVELAGIDLAALLALVEVEGLMAEGRLGGRLPIRLDADGFAIIEGRLAAEEDGRISYDPANPPAFLASGSSALLGQALENFHFSSLSVEIDGSLGGEQSVIARIAGANPDLYGGHPIDLTVNLSGALDTLVRRALLSSDLPDALKRRLEGGVPSTVQ